MVGSVGVCIQLPAVWWLSDISFGTAVSFLLSPRVVSPLEYSEDRVSSQVVSAVATVEVSIS